MIISGVQEAFGNPLARMNVVEATSGSTQTKIGGFLFKQKLKKKFEIHFLLSISMYGAD